MATPNIQPDTLYTPDRESLLPYEDARFNGLMSKVPNCYSPLTDYAIWGAFVRAAAQEMARMEYLYTYSLVSLEPQYLTPPDIQRKFAAPLFINKSYPNAAQTDQDYKAMLVALLPAYRMGTTLEAIVAVIKAYTGQTVNVEELYTEIGTNGVHDYDRNTLRLSMNGATASGTNPLSAIVAAAWIQTISQDLVTAISLAKPAHIGLDYSVVFGSSENMAAKIEAMTDTLAILFEGYEPPPLPEVFTQAPLENLTSPDTRLSAYGALASTYLMSPISAGAWASLPYASFKAEYQANEDGTYSLIPACASDVLLVDGSNVVTGVVSKAQGVLSPQLVRSWSIKNEDYRIYEID